ncbi:hypothetical protein KI655_06520 [Vibrio sp. D404a]|uniref:hypothetical protein n=1 Tax=unclassified Vibrio TaxID=2614977 RepID=UPI0025522612|nr:MULTISPECIES: hypothetical protein [unclassified Vibrio]MDK9736953.1 hypothetical protein [Vibrio sp. D404a]MDK9798100.1 hypothetical protein [Vibrio sp. D449a]
MAFTFSLESFLDRFSSLISPLRTKRFAFKPLWIGVGSVFLLSACSAVTEQSKAYPLDESGNYYVVSSTELVADGAEGEETYDLIEGVLGRGSIEAPDLYGSANHAGERHITEANDPKVGNHFVFHIHVDEDKDRDKVEITDRQRNEIKVYAKSDDHLKGALGKTFEYRWAFKVSDDLAVSKNFTHLFQLKAVKARGSAGITNSPLLTLTANTRSGKSGLEVRHVHYNSDRRGTENNTLAHTARMKNVDWNKDIQGQWLEVFVRAHYHEQGSLYMTVTKLGESQPLIEVDEPNLEMWRSGDLDGKGHFVRPKWGIYRSLKSKHLLKDEQVSFANFVIQEVKLIEEVKQTER